MQVEFESFPVKKCTVKTTPSTSISQITSQACSSFGLAPPEAYVLYNKKLLLQASLSVRLSGLAAGSKLTLVYKGVSSQVQKITIALQTEENGRLMGNDQFDSLSSLWDVLLFFESKASDGSVNLTRKTGVPPKKNLFQVLNAEVYMMPVIVFMNKEYSTISLLQSTTLGDIGLTSGSAALRLLFQFTGSSINHYLPEIEKKLTKREKLEEPKVPSPTVNAAPNPIASSSSATGITTASSAVAKTAVSENTVEPNNLLPTKRGSQEELVHTSLATSRPIKAQAEQLIADQVAKVSVEEDIPNIESDIKIYKPAPDSASSANIVLPPSFFSLTSSELKVLVDSQRNQLKALENKPLMTQAMRDREKRLNEKKHPKTMIRVRFPDRYILEATFYSGALVSELYKIVSARLAPNHQSSFRLYIAPPQQNLDPTLTFWGMKLAPASLVHFQSDGGQTPYLTSLSEAIDYPVIVQQQPPPVVEDTPMLSTAAADNDEARDREEYIRKSNQAANAFSSSSSSSAADNDSKPQRPKWFKGVGGK